ncbi:MAG: MogA/MoaB family molybdenum cofactor biosynthesis protein [Anaerolineae bacterium]|nr:MogA/MoaB family molybdenum cofactor biosynthesis protein [Gemmatimonadaceae bacterium]
MRLALLTISDAGARGERKDTSGDTVVAWGESRNYSLTAREIVSDDTVPIVSQLVQWCDADAADLVLTTGGTGLSSRDITPEATLAVIEREAPGIAERIRITCIDSFPRAALSRGIAGARNRTLIVNLPGSASGVRDALAALDPIIDHAVAILRGDATDHSHGAVSRTP